MIVISPHLDDAVWSASAMLEGSTVITICAGIPPPGTPITSFDRESGFKSAVQAMRVRRAEDHAAAELGHFAIKHLNCLDGAYADNTNTIPHAVQMVLMFAESRDERVLGPIGLRHPDHKLIASLLPDDVWRYEELPYAYAWPERTGHVETMPGAEWKEDAVRCYRSQIRPSTHMNEILSPERYHR